MRTQILVLTLGTFNCRSIIVPYFDRVVTWYCLIIGSGFGQNHSTVDSGGNQLEDSLFADCTVWLLCSHFNPHAYNHDAIKTITVACEY